MISTTQMTAVFAREMAELESALSLLEEYIAGYRARLRAGGVNRQLDDDTKKHFREASEAVATHQLAAIRLFLAQLRQKIPEQLDELELAISDKLILHGTDVQGIVEAAESKVVAALKSSAVDGDGFMGTGLTYRELMALRDAELEKEAASRTLEFDKDAV